MNDCGQIQQRLWTGEADRTDVASHVQGCEACSVEARRAQQLAGVLANMQYDLAFPPAELESALISAIPRSPVDRARDVVAHPKFWRGAAVGAAAATVAAFGVIVARRMGRPELVG